MANKCLFVVNKNIDNLGKTLNKLKSAIYITLIIVDLNRILYYRDTLPCSYVLNLIA